MKNTILLFACLAIFSTINAQDLIFERDQVSTFTFQDLLDLERDREGNLWTCSKQERLYKKENGTWSEINVPFTLGDEYAALAFDSNNKLYMATAEAGIYTYDGSSWDMINTDNSNMPYDQKLRDIQIDENDNIFVLDWDGHFYWYDGSDWKDESENLDNGTPNTFLITSQDQIYVGGGTSWYTYDYFFEDWSHFDLGLLDASKEPRINSFYEESPAVMWFCTDEGLISFGGAISEDYHLSKKYGVQEMVIASDGKVWMATTNEKFLVTPTNTNSPTEYDRADHEDIPFQTFQFLPTDDERVLFFGTTGANIYSVKEGTTSISELPTFDASIYPNPSSTYFQIESKTEIKEAVLYDMQGKKVKSISSGFSERIDISELTGGKYTLVLHNTIGEVSRLSLVKMD